MKRALARLIGVRAIASVAAAAVAACVPASAPPDPSDFAWVALRDLDAPTRAWIEEGEALDPATVLVAKAELDVPPGPGGEELLVRYLGEGDCGPGCGQLKVFRDDGAGRRLVLTEYGRSLRRGPAVHQGLADILVDGTPFRFDGEDYQPAGLVEGP